MICTPGATPAEPSPLPARAPAIPATPVPWLLPPAFTTSAFAP
jgi:hypothetical protein